MISRDVQLPDLTLSPLVSMFPSATTVSPSTPSGSRQVVATIVHPSTSAGSDTITAPVAHPSSFSETGANVGSKCVDMAGSVDEDDSGTEGTPVDTAKEVPSVANAIVLGYDRRVPALHDLFFCMGVRSSRGSSASSRLNMPSV